MKCGEGPYSYQQNVSAIAGFGVLITFIFFIYIVLWDRSQLVGLSISLRSIAKASYARHCRNTNVSSNFKQNIVKHNIYQIDAFTDTIFGGNPACVVPLDNWLSDEILLKIAKENAVAETAFFVDKGEKIHLRWFTPEIEMDLCGHATLATAHSLATILDYKKDKIVFETLSGDLIVKIENGKYKMNFPSRMPIVDILPPTISKSLNIQPKEILKSRDYVLVYENETEVRNIKIDRQLFDQINIDPGGVIVTAIGDNCDFISRFFTPQASILEDPVTGSAHCSLIPFWAKRLNKKELYAQQVSERLGKLYCEDKGDRVIISGQAKTYSIGEFWTE